MGLIPKHLCNAHCMYYDTHAQNALDDPQGHLVHLAMVYSQFSHLCGIIIYFKQIYYFFYLITLGLLDNTSQRNLAHIQRLILLNYYFNSITDTTVSTFFLGNIRPVSTTSPKVIFYFIFTFFQTQLLAYNLEKYLQLVLTPRSTTIQLTHGCEQQFLAYQTALQWSPSLTKSMFSHLFRQITQIIVTIYHKYNIFYNQLREYPKYSQYLKQFPPI